MDVKGLGPGARAAGPTAGSSSREKFFVSDANAGESRAAFQGRVLAWASAHSERPVQEIGFTSQQKHVAGGAAEQHYATVTFEE